MLGSKEDGLSSAPRLMKAFLEKLLDLDLATELQLDLLLKLNVSCPAQHPLCQLAALPLPSSV